MIDPLVPLQEVTVPGKATPNIPEAIPAGPVYSNNIDFGAKPVNAPRRITNIPLAATTGDGMIKELEMMKLKNSQKILQMDLMIKAYETQLESYKVVNQLKYMEVLQQKLDMMDKYQVICYEQNLVNRELKFLTKQQDRLQSEDDENSSFSP